MNNFQEILDLIVNQESKKTVGILLKRIELIVKQVKKENRNHITFQELETLKAEQREIIYEAYRNLRDFLKTGKIILDFSKSKEGETNGK